jgi:hypothetical protein
MKYNALLRRKNKFEPLATVTELEIPDNLNQEQKEDFAAPFLVAKAELYVDLELIKDEKPHGNAKTT